MVFDLAYSTSLLHPPYVRAHRVIGINAVNWKEFRPGSILWIELPNLPRDIFQLANLVNQWRRRFPYVPVAVQVAHLDSRALHFAAQIPRMHGRAILVAGEPVHNALRLQLTGPRDLGREVVAWLPLHGYSVPPMLGSVIRQIFARAAELQSIEQLLDEIGEPATTTRLRFRRSALPSPSGWLRAARALQCAHRIQAEPEQPLLPMAIQMGYADHSALSSQVHRCFQLRPGAIRGTFGWEWLMNRWIDKQRKAHSATCAS